MAAPRISTRQLEVLVARINQITRSPFEPWTRDAGGKLRANVGNYHLDGAYGGYALRQMMCESGSEKDPLETGHVPKKELYRAMVAFIAGLETRAASA